MGCAWKIEIKQQPSSADSHCLDSRAGAGPEESTSPLTAAQGHVRLPECSWCCSVEIPGLSVDALLGIQALVQFSGDPRSVDG